jgi:hypothetical protein
MRQTLISIGTFKKRLKEASSGCMSPGEIEEYVLATTDLEALCQEDRRRLQWICETIVWPVTRPRRRRPPNPTPLLFNDESEAP